MDDMLREDAPEGFVNLTGLPFELDDGIAARARIGVIVLASDHTVEHEFRAVMNLPGVAFYEARIANDPNITPETLRAMEGRIAQTAELILPGVPLDVVCYGCTSASMVIGEERVFELVRQARPEARVTTPITGAFAAFRAMGARRIGVLTPYRDDINRFMRDYIEARGFEVPVFGSFNEENDNCVACIAPASIRTALLEIGRRDNVDAVFVSCTSLRLAQVAAEVEAELGKPVTSSNHAMAWHALRLAGIDDAMPVWGSLYEHGL
jgi:maleate isomerase